MENKNKFTVCITAYNRPDKLNYLLDQLSRVIIPKEMDFMLRISIDGPENMKMKEVIQKWLKSFENVSVQYYEKNLGLKKHIIAAGDWCAERGDFMMLEEDLIISPLILDMGLKMLKAYQNSEKVKQLSLYSIDWNEFDDVPFWPSVGGNPVYFVQTGSSWGQIWKSEWWNEFKAWYLLNKEKSITEYDLHPTIFKWGESSWKKYFNAFLVEKDYLVAYPTDSFSLHNGENGTNYKGGRVIGNFKPLSDFISGTIRFPDCNNTHMYYDQFLRCCITGNKIKLVQNINILGSYSIPRLAKELVRRVFVKLMVFFKLCR